MAADLNAVYDRDPACGNYLQALSFKGFLALQVYRVAHWLFVHDRKVWCALGGQAGGYVFG